MQPTPFAELNQVLAVFLARIRRPLGEDLVGAYLQGSFAVGGADEHSDVDFVVLVKGELRAAQVDALQQIHDQVYALGPEWAKHLEGSYFPLATFRDQTKTGTDLWYLDHGARSLTRCDHCNTLIVRWTVREKGVALCGPPPATLLDPIPTAALRKEIFHTITFWGKKILEDPARYNNRFYQGFIALSYCRMLHDLHRGYPGSKHEGAEWAKAVLDASWSALIDRTWVTRPDPARQIREPADPEDFQQTLRLVELVMAKSRRFMEEALAPETR